MEDLDTILEKLINGVVALPESGMRLDYVAGTLSRRSAEDAARLLGMSYEKGRGERGRRALRFVLVDHAGLKNALGPTRCARIYHASVRLGLRKVSRLFTEPGPLRKGLAGYDKEEEAGMEHVTLGQRRAMSKLQAKDTLDRMLSDPDPVVIGNILANPRVTEKEVLKIASKRPNSPAILDLLAGHRVWSKRYAVIKAIVSNPYSLPRTAVALLELMLAQDLRKTAGDATLHPLVRGGARDILREREG
jgi:hypothetical protein